MQGFEKGGYIARKKIPIEFFAFLMLHVLMLLFSHDSVQE